MDWSDVLDKLRAGTATTFAFEGDSLPYGQKASGDPDGSIAAINGASQLRVETPLPETFAQVLALFYSSSITFENRGYPGDRTDEWLARWGASSVADVTFINYCLNDASNYGGHSGPNTIAVYEANLRSIISSRQTSGSFVILILPMASDGSAQRINEKIFRSKMQAVAEDMGCPWIDSFEVFQPRGLVRADGIHLRARDQAEMAMSCAAMFHPQSNMVPVVSPGKRVLLRPRPTSVTSFSTSGTGVSRLREAGGLDIGTSVSKDRYLAVYVEAPCRLVVEYNCVTNASLAYMRTAYGAPVALKGDGTALTDTYPVESPRDFMEYGSGASTAPQEPCRGPVLYPGWRLVSLMNDIDLVVNHYVSGLWFEPVDLVPEWVNAQALAGGGRTVPNIADLNPGTLPFAQFVVIGGPRLYYNLDANLVLIDKLTGNTGYRLELDTTRHLVLTIGNGTTTTSYTSPVAAEYNQWQRFAFGFTMRRTGRVFFHCNGESLGSVVCSGSSGYNITNAMDLVILPGATGIYAGPLVNKASTTGTPQVMDMLHFGPAVVAGANTYWAP